MPDKPTEPREYRFEIDTFTPDTIPLSRLSEYLSDIARLMGESANVHLVRIDTGSTVPVIRVDWEAEPKVLDRLRSVEFEDGPSEARKAYKQINKRLMEDNASGALIDPGKGKVVRFPGRDAADQLEFGPLSEPGSFQGIPIKIGGKGDPVPVHLEDGEERSIVSAPRRIAKQLAAHLFTSMVRVKGKARWMRDKAGDWQLLDFYVQDFEVLQGGNLKETIETLRAIPGDWKTHDDPLAELLLIRTGEGPQ